MNYLGRLVRYWLTVFVLGGAYSTAMGSTSDRAIPRQIVLVAGDAAACTGTTSITCPSGYTGDGGAGTATKLSTPRGLAVDVYGNVFIADSNNNVVRRVDVVTGVITTYAGGATAVCSGGDTIGNGCPASQAALSSPRQLAMDNQGNLLIADFSTNQIRKVDRWTGIIILVAGSSTGCKLTPSVSCSAGFSGDGGAANKALLNGPRDLAVDGGNNLYVVDSGNNAIRRVDGANGMITTVAGQPSLGKTTASAGYNGDGIAAATAQLNNPQGISVDASGDVYIADSNNRIIRRVDVITGIITTVAGQTPTGTCAAPVPSSGCTYHAKSPTLPVLAANATLNNPISVFVDHAGDLLISDASANLLLRVDPQTGYMFTLAGGAASGCTTNTDPLGDGCLGTQARFNNIFASKEDAFGVIYLTDASNNLIRKITPGTVFPVAPTGSSISQTVDILASAGTPSFTVSPSSDFQLSSPAACTSNADNSSDCLLTINFTPVAGGLRAAGILVANADSTTSSVAVQGYGSAAVLSVDPGLATSLSGVTNPGQLARDSSGAIYVADTGGNVVRKFAAGSATGVVVAGTGSAGYSGDGGDAASATLNAPQSVAVDAAGNLYVADTGNNVLRKITYPVGTISTIAGGASANCASSSDAYGDGCPVTQSMLSGPLGVTADTASNVFIADTGHNLVREVQVQSGNIYIVAGGTSAVCSASTDALGDGCLGTQSTLQAPSGLTIDSSFNLIIADSGNNIVRRIGIVGGIITAIAGNTQAGFSGDGGAATAAALSNPTGVALDDGSNLAIADAGNNAIRFVSSSTGTISTLAGNGTSGNGGTNAPATALAFNSPRGVSFDDTGNLYFGDSGNNHLESVARTTGALAFGVLNTGSPSPEQQLR